MLAVSFSIGWRGALGAALSGLATLAALTAVSSGLLATGTDIGLMQFVVGVFLMLFGVRWLANAIARYAGLKPLHDEALEFQQTRAKLFGDWAASWAIAFKGVLLDGLEVWLVVVALGTRSPGNAGMASSVGAALAALALTCLVGMAVRAPLQQVLENTIKFVVGAMIVSWHILDHGGDRRRNNLAVRRLDPAHPGRVLPCSRLRRRNRLLQPDPAEDCAMGPFLKTLFGDARNVAVVVAVVALEFALVSVGWGREAVLLVPMAAVAGVAVRAAISEVASTGGAGGGCLID